MASFCIALAEACATSELFLSRWRIICTEAEMFTFLLWCLLLVLCWPVAIAALFLYPIVWLILLPFRIVGVAVGGVLELIWGMVTLPVTLLRRLARA
jgi:hypothetical protein